MLVSAHDGRVDHHVLIIGIAGQQLENPLENADLCPSAEALVYDLPVAKTRRQITPGNARSVSIKNRVNEQAVVRCSAADMAFPARANAVMPASFPDGTSNTILTAETLKGDGGTKAVTVKRQYVLLDKDALKEVKEDTGVKYFKEFADRATYQGYSVQVVASLGF